VSEKQPSWMDWVLYFGSKDERHRRSADRAGHGAFLLALGLATVDLVLRLPAVRTDLVTGVLSMSTDLGVILVAGGYYTLRWVWSGITLKDTPPQRRFLFWLCPAAGLATGAILFWVGQNAQGWAGAGLVALVGGGVAWGLCWVTYRWVDRAASRRNESQPGGEHDRVPK
jgi:hypothetical protein